MMEMQLAGEMDLVVDRQGFGSLLGLLSGGVGVPAPAGCDLDTFFHRCLGLDPDYAATRVRTVFLNGRPVDDTARAVLAPGDEVALSTAMPGLVGICMRRDSPIRSFRRDITHDPRDEKAPAAQEGETIPVTVRLFNFIALEIGPGLLDRGVHVSGERLARAMADGVSILDAALDGVTVDPGQVRDAAKRAGAALFFLRVKKGGGRAANRD
ncbi:MAG: hypothetical protein ACOY4F_07200 [Thermodesulfobacteriota bacterium]